MTSNHHFQASILHETPDWIAINKPDGIGMHTEDEQPGIVVRLSDFVGEKLWPVHRLDKVTSGVLLMARNGKAAAQLGKLFEHHDIQKFYIAQSTDKPTKKQGWIKGDMEKSRNGSWKLTRRMDNPAITRFLSSYSESRQRRQFLLAPKTGKTHQLRVALKSVGSPIEGDQRYKGTASDRTYLHAAGLVFNWQGEHIEVTAPPERGDWSGIPPEWLTGPWKILGQ
ncbi:MAG: TIGR01621 family pseudouridine synthase [Oceanospirillaceae bacterium]|nr:TIGR01621 family pseudouridine synthase [Oceanospirillaceae bacterium]